MSCNNFIIYFFIKKFSMSVNRKLFGINTIYNKVYVFSPVIIMKIIRALTTYLRSACFNSLRVIKKTLKRGGILDKVMK